MMKVICVNHNRYDGDVPFGPTDPQIGDECEVRRAITGYNSYGKPVPVFDLIGYNEFYYDQRNFAIISSIDETELVNEKIEATA